MSDDLVFLDNAPEAGGVPAAAPEEVAPVTETEQEASAEVEHEEGGEDEPVEPVKPNKKPGSARWREKAAQARQEAEFWKAQALSGKPQPTPAQAVPNGMPKADDYASIEEYEQAKIDHMVRQGMEREKAKEVQQTRIQGWEQKAQAAREKYEDFDEAIESAAAPSQGVAEVLFDSPLGGELAYHLANNPDEYKRINSLPPARAAYELAKLEAKLEQPQEKPKPTVTQSKAPKPITPVKPSAHVAVQDNGRLEVY